MRELAQSPRKVLFFQRETDGLYLGTIAGVILGAVAGILVIRGYSTREAAITPGTFMQMSYETFLAGLALKGVAEAVTGGFPQQ